VNGAWAVIAFAVALAAAAPAAQGSCNATAPNGSTPPGTSTGSTSAHGNDRMWVYMNTDDGTLVADPRGWPWGPKLYPDGSVASKFLWHARPLRRRARFTIVARRLDGPAKPFRFRSRWLRLRQGVQALPSGIRFSTPGCWEVVGRLGPGMRLAWVVSVELPPG
jgi:hypothetical protein